MQVVAGPARGRSGGKLRTRLNAPLSGWRRVSLFSGEGVDSGDLLECSEDLWSTAAQPMDNVRNHQNLRSVSMAMLEAVGQGPVTHSGIKRDPSQPGRFQYPAPSHHGPSNPPSSICSGHVRTLRYLRTRIP